MPLYSVVFLMVTFSSIGLPGTNGFVGEFLILIGTFKTAPVYTAIAATGVVFGAVTMLWMVKRVFFGPVTHEENKGLKDLSFREIMILAPIVVAIFGIGFAPGFLLKKMDKSTEKFIERVTTEKVPINATTSSN
jgi:NADH-quinone oxidoreductase subunit M